MNKQTIGYWVTTVFLAIAIGMGGVMDLMAPPDLAEGRPTSATRPTS
jgi:hypothetical protein